MSKNNNLTAKRARELLDQSKCLYSDKMYKEAQKLYPSINERILKAIKSRHSKISIYFKWKEKDVYDKVELILKKNNFFVKTLKWRKIELYELVISW